MTSQDYVAYNLLIEKIESLSQGTILDDEKTLVSTILEESLRRYNAPIWISKLNTKVQAIGSSHDDVIDTMFDKYNNFGAFSAFFPAGSLNTSQKKVELLGLFSTEIGLLIKDMQSAKQIYPSLQEVDSREDLIRLRRLRQFVFNYLTQGLNFEGMQQTRGFGFFRIKHSKGIQLIQEIDAYLNGTAGAFTSAKTQMYIDKVNRHIDNNIQKDSLNSISKSMKKL